MRTAHGLLGEGLLHRQLNPINDRLNIRHHGKSRKTYHAKVIPVQPDGAPFIADDLALFTMPAAIYFHYQARREANEVGKTRP